MDIVVPRKDLLRLLSRVQGVVEKKTTIPLLSSVLLVAVDPGVLHISATDMYLSLLGKMGAEVKQGGNIAVSAKDLLERVKMMPEGSIHLQTQASGLVLKSKGSARRYSLRGMPGDDFPPLPTPQENAPSLSLGADVLKELIDTTRFSISTDETRPHLNSALFEWDGEMVRMVTTDGHRLSKMQVRVPGKQASLSMLIPLKAVYELRGFCEDILHSEMKSDVKDRSSSGGSKLQLSQSGSNAFFQSDTLSFGVKLVEAQFPPYQQVIPKHSDKHVLVSRASFAEALKAISISANEKTGGVKISISQKSMRIQSESPERGEGFDEISVEYQGPELTVGFNARYFLDVLSSLSGDDVLLSLSGELDPGMVSMGKPLPDKEFVAVVMPMRI